MQTNNSLHRCKDTKLHERTNKNKNKMTLRTTIQQEKAKKWRKCYNDYRHLADDPKNSRTAIVQYLMGKYGISYNTVYKIIKQGGEL